MPRPVPQHEFFGWDSRCEQEALQLIAADLAQYLRLMAGFYTFGHHAQTKLMPKIDDRLDDGKISGRVEHVSHERAVDLQTVERNPVQIAETRVAGAKVVERELDA